MIQSWKDENNKDEDTKYLEKPEKHKTNKVQVVWARQRANGKKHSNGYFAFSFIRLEYIQNEWIEYKLKFKFNIFKNKIFYIIFKERTVAFRMHSKSLTF